LKADGERDQKKRVVLEERDEGWEGQGHRAKPGKDII